MGFFKSFLKELIKDGNTIDIAANISESDVPSCYRDWGCKIYPLSCTRSPLDKSNFRAIKEIRKITADGNYDIVHCHTPVAAMCTRLACRKQRKAGTKVIYTAHGFHFYKGAPLKNWLLYYPVEWFCSFWTDMLITINKEDYARAKKHMHAKQVEYVPGVGIDLQKFTSGRLSKDEKDRLRESVGVGKEDKMLLSVGELNVNKNHAVVIQAIAALQNPNIHYSIAGSGDLHDYLLNLAAELGISEQVHLLGFRNDVSDLYQAADLYIHPSKREGLPVALMEAIASKAPAICSNIRGNTDLVGGKALFETENVSQISEKINEYLSSDAYEEVERNYTTLRKFDIEKVIDKMKNIYRNI